MASVPDPDRDARRARESYDAWRKHVEENPEELCREPEPHCSALLTDTEAVLSDRRRWPDHLCGDLVEVSLSTWARSHAWRVFGDPLPEMGTKWEREMPLPVGLWSLLFYGKRQRSRRRVGPYADVMDAFEKNTLLNGSPESRQLGRLAVLPLVEKAIFIRTEYVKLSTVTMFCLVDDHPYATGRTGRPIRETGEPWVYADIRFIVAGDPFDKRVQTFCRNARSWWLERTEQSIKGRPKGSITWTLWQIEALVMEYTRETGTWPPRKERFLAWPGDMGRGGPSDDTVNRRLREHGFASWPAWITTLSGPPQ